MIDECGHPHKQHTLTHTYTHKVLNISILRWYFRELIPTMIDECGHPHTYTHTHAHTYTHTQRAKHRHSTMVLTRADTHNDRQVWKSTHTQTLTHTHPHTHTHNVQELLPTEIDDCENPHTHTHTNTHTHTQTHNVLNIGIVRW